MRSRFLALTAAAVLSVGGAIGAAGSPQPAAAATAPCGTLATAPTYSHVIWVWMENHSYGRHHR